jgi:hypothetical protein
MLIASPLWQAGFSDDSCELDRAELWLLHRVWSV